MLFHCNCGAYVQYDAIEDAICGSCGVPLEMSMQAGGTMVDKVEHDSMLPDLSDTLPQVADIDGNLHEYDVAVHHVEHRGGGKYFVMRGEEKLYRIEKTLAKTLES